MNPARNVAAACPCDDHAVGKKLQGVEEAIERAIALAQPLAGTETVSLGNALGRTLGKTALAARAQPFFDNSAMDGFAVHSSCFPDGRPASLPIAGEIAAGSANNLSLPENSCMRIFTGAPIPQGADAVVPLEHVCEDGQTARFEIAPAPGAHIRHAGSDIARNAVLVTRGTRLRPRHIGLLAANGYGAVNVMARPVAGVFSTGDEVIAPGSRAGNGQLYDANRPMLIGALGEAGCEVVDLGILRDDPSAIRDFLNANRDRFDLLVSSGSVSVGHRDFLKDALLEAGGRIDSWKVAIKPGKPVVFGRLGSALFLGLPGNTYAAWIGMQLFGKAIVGALAGATRTSHELSRGRAGCGFPHRRGRREYVPVRIIDENGSSVLTRLGNGSSASLHACVNADGLAIIEAGTGDILPGDSLRFLRFCNGEFS